jgi:FSR family fosmidomycin resistance protein-like MFS transporter
MAAFLPKYLSDAGWQPASYGLMIALFSGGSALGTLFGGRAADRLGKWRVIFFGLGLGAVPFFLIPLADYSWWLYVLVPLSGFLTSSCFNAIIVLAQHLFTVGVGLASGLTLGFIFASGALGTLLSGKLADLYGFDPVFYLSGALALGGSLLGLLFRKR